MRFPQLAADRFFFPLEAASPVPFSGLPLSVCVVGTPRREKERAALAEIARVEREREREGETEQYTMEKQHYWLFKMVFTENNQSEGIIARLVTPGTNVLRRSTRRPLFPSRPTLASPRRSFISCRALRLIIFRLIGTHLMDSVTDRLVAQPRKFQIINLIVFNMSMFYLQIINCEQEFRRKGKQCGFIS